MSCPMHMTPARRRAQRGRRAAPLLASGGGTRDWAGRAPKLKRSVRSAAAAAAAAAALYSLDPPKNGGRGAQRPPVPAPAPVRLASAAPAPRGAGRSPQCASSKASKRSVQRRS